MMDFSFFLLSTVCKMFLMPWLCVSQNRQSSKQEKDRNPDHCSVLIPVQFSSLSTISANIGGVH